jgi:hypothetical protein
MTVEAEVWIEVLSREEALALLDEQARKLLGMSAEEFVRAWNEGGLAQDKERHLELIHLAMLIPYDC